MNCLLPGRTMPARPLHRQATTLRPTRRPGAGGTHDCSMSDCPLRGKARDSPRGCRGYVRILTLDRTAFVKKNFQKIAHHLLPPVPAARSSLVRYEHRVNNAQMIQAMGNENQPNRQSCVAAQVDQVKLAKGFLEKNPRACVWIGRLATERPMTRQQKAGVTTHKHGSVDCLTSFLGEKN